MSRHAVVVLLLLLAVAVWVTTGWPVADHGPAGFLPLAACVTAAVLLTTAGGRTP